MTQLIWNGELAMVLADGEAILRRARPKPAPATFYTVALLRLLHGGAQPASPKQVVSFMQQEDLSLQMAQHGIVFAQIRWESLHGRIVQALTSSNPKAALNVS